MLVQHIPRAKGATVIDVRSREEYDLGHAKGAVHIPWDLHLYYLEDLQELPTPWLFCCEEGVRSGFVVLSLKMLGFEEVYNIGRWIDVEREFAGLEKTLGLIEILPPEGAPVSNLTTPDAI